MPQHKWRIAAAAIGVVCTVQMLNAPLAHADESSYLNALSAAGYYGPIQHWLNIGYTVCAMTDAGATIGQEATVVYRNTNDSVGWDSATRVVELANVYLC